MLPPKKSVQSVPVSNHRTIYFINRDAYLKHLAWEGEMWVELSQLTKDSVLEASESNLGECAVHTSLDMGLAFELDAIPTTTTIN